MRKEPEFIQVPFGSIIPWAKNPREIDPAELEALAESIRHFGQFQVLTCWPADGGQFETGGGNMRWRAMKERLGYPPERPIWISLNFPENEQEKIELSLRDNQKFGRYVLPALTDLILPYADKIKVDEYKIDIAPPVSLRIFTDPYAPPGDGEGGPERKEEFQCPKCGFRWAR